MSTFTKSPGFNLREEWMITSLSTSTLSNSVLPIYLPAGRYIGRTEFDSVEVDNEVIIHSSRKLNPGDFVNVLITKAYDYDLEGDVV